MSIFSYEAKDLQRTIKKMIDDPGEIGRHQADNVGVHKSVVADMKAGHITKDGKVEVTLTGGVFQVGEGRMERVKDSRHPTTFLEEE